MDYKYSLDRSSRKFICPQCQKRTFVRYMDNECKSYMEGAFGRCDRESKCGYHLPPKGNSSIVGNYAVPSPIFHCMPDEVLVYFSKGMRLYKNKFFYGLAHAFSGEDLLEAQKRFFIGTAGHWEGDTIFWQIDEQFQVRTGKVMLYDPNTRKRVKEPYPYIHWMHKIVRYKAYILEQCLFGLHQIIGENFKTVCIVESEKTAVIMSILFPEYLWMATGSKNGFKEKMLETIKGFKIIAFPDKSEYQDWENVSKVLNNKGYTIKCSSFNERFGIREGCDLADYFF